ncbi:hypothetical protein NMG60_11025289 [Bertholletia excelsa]
MAEFVSILDNPQVTSSASSSAPAISDDYAEDACSICLEPFNTEDPPTVTNCKHEYHLQCILEWSQRSKECPICWQLLLLKDPASQELLAAVENERNMRSRNAQRIHEDIEIDHDNIYTDDSDFDERIMRHFAAAARRARYLNRRGRQRSSGTGSSQPIFSLPTGDPSDVLHMHSASAEERHLSGYEISDDNSTNFTMLNVNHAQTPSSVVPDNVNVDPNSVNDSDGCFKHSQLSPNSPKGSSSSEFLVFSQSIKSKFSAASARYKESISKSTQGFKEKLLAHNFSVKELGRGVQREMNAGIAGVARMIERIDLASKRTGGSVLSSNNTGGTSNFCYKENEMQESLVTHSPKINAEETANDMSSASSSYVQFTIPGRVEVAPSQSRN